MTTHNIEKMIRLSLEKKYMLNEILSLTKMQSNYIEADDMDKINSVLMKKEEVIGKIDNLDKEFLQLYQIVKEEEDIDSIHMIDIRKYDNLKSLKNAVNEINIILDQITKVDKENTEKMRTSIDKIKSELKLVKKGQKAHKGYNYNIGESILIDEKKIERQLSIFLFPFLSKLSRVYS